MNHRPLVFLDIETTGGSAKTSRITEIGALRVEEGKVVGTFRQLVNPEEPIPYYITRITNITDEMVWGAPTFKAIAQQLESFLSGSLFIAHNVSFDYSFIKAEYERIGVRFAMDRMCTARLSRALYPEHKSHALDRLIERMDLQVAERHRAYDDAAVLHKFFETEYDRAGLALFQHMNKLVTYSK
jgi:DNA polymerase-3 subunit epsilon